jgi:hypothetical protein
MRIWSIHPKYLDKKGLGGVWCETLLAKAVLGGKTKGYKHHPQLIRFRESPNALGYISSYLKVVHDEATKRGLSYDETKIGPVIEPLKPIPVTKGQLEYEWKHLVSKLQKRSPELLSEIKSDFPPSTNPIFEVVDGEVESWEIVDPPEQTKRKTKAAKKRKASGTDVEPELKETKVDEEELAGQLRRSTRSSVVNTKENEKTGKKSQSSKTEKKPVAKKVVRKAGTTHTPGTNDTSRSKVKEVGEDKVEGKKAKSSKPVKKNASMNPKKSSDSSSSRSNGKRKCSRKSSN